MLEHSALIVVFALEVAVVVVAVVGGSTREEENPHEN